MKNAIPLICLAFVTIWLRLINLGYSDYQGDEIKALYLPQPGQGLWDFLLSQRKGPLQFLVTYVLKIFNPSYDNEFLIRLPFAVAGILAIYFFYKFVKLQFGEKIALYSSFLVAINGLFIAFSRIVQYQSFVILFSFISLYSFSLSTKYKNWRIYGLYLGFCFWGLAILGHYDGIFIFPFVFYILYQWYKDNSSIQKYLKHLTLAFSIFLLMIAVFYIPFSFSVSETTKSYWSQRITEEAGGDSLSIFSIYNPTIIIYIYIILGLLSLFKFKSNFSVILWFLAPLFFMEVLIKQPRTHIYTYILPLSILIPYGLEVLRSFSKKIFGAKAKFINNLSIAILVLTFSVANVVFLDNTKEYQWEEKNFLVWNFPRKHEEGLFGFPYYRHWEEIGTFLKTAGKNGYYITNEKPSITTYYVPAGFKDLQLQEFGDMDGYIYVIYIKNPQSLDDAILGKEQDYWQQYTPLKTFFNNNKAISHIYRLSASEWQKIKPPAS